MRHNARCSGEMRVGEESVEYLKPIMRHQADVEECRADGTVYRLSMDLLASPPTDVYPGEH